MKKIKATTFYFDVGLAAASSSIIEARAWRMKKIEATTFYFDVGLAAASSFIIEARASAMSSFFAASLSWVA